MGDSAKADEGTRRAVSQGAESGLGIRDPLDRAREITRQTALRHDADISTLFVVRDRRRLELAAGFVRLEDREISLPASSAYELDWTSDAPRGLTARVAVSGKSLSVGSLDELRALTGHLGVWDSQVYPAGIDDAELGFGCLYAVPLRLSQSGPPEDVVIGVFKIERRCNRPPFADSDCMAFELVAGHLSTILQDYAQIKQAIDDIVKRVDGDFAQLHAILSRLTQLGPDRPADQLAGEARAEANRAIAATEQLGRRLRELFAAATDRPRGADSFFRYLEVRVVPVTPDEASRADLPNADHACAIALVKQGFAGLSGAEEDSENALRNLEEWLSKRTFRKYVPAILWLIERERWSTLRDSFYQLLPFGTGGRRGGVGIGPNRFNSYTLAASVQGHIDYLRETQPGNLSVVIAYDVRVFHDARGEFTDPVDGGRCPNPLYGMTSRDFARHAAEIYVANNVKVFMLPEDSGRYLSTPELSYTIRALGASAGLNVSASHNPADDNGSKFYNRHGGQEVPPYDENMARRVENVAYLASLDFDHATATGLISWIPDEVHEDYLGMNLRQSLHPEARDARVVFTPLHGTSGSTVGEVLRRAGFDVWFVEQQATPDGDFPEVRFGIANPEIPESMEQAEELARRIDADVVIACDPDADRIGVCSRTAAGAYQFLTGNEIALLVAHYKLEHLKQQGRLPRRPLVIKTEVTTELLQPVTESFGGTVIGDLLVGFKYHGNVLEQLSKHGRFQDVEAHLEDFVVGVEESHGVLVTSEVRDKDAAGAALLVAELAVVERRRGRTIADYLNDIYLRFGYYAERVLSIVMSGAEGRSKIQRIQTALRAEPPERIGRWRVVKVADHWDESGVHGPFLSETDRTSRNVLVFHLENRARVIVRPSGTEPKSKIYIEVPSSPLGAGAAPEDLEQQRKETNRLAQELGDEFTRLMLAAIDVRLPDYALRISGLVALDLRIGFVERFLPGLKEQALSVLENGDARATASAWVDEHLAVYGRDARELVREAFDAFIRCERERIDARDPTAVGSECLATMEQVFYGS